MLAYSKTLYDLWMELFNKRSHGFEAFVLTLLPLLWNDSSQTTRKP
jgi:hypothetical protein